MQDDPIGIMALDLARDTCPRLRHQWIEQIFHLVRANRLLAEIAICFTWEKPSWVLAAKGDELYSAMSLSKRSFEQGVVVGDSSPKWVRRADQAYPQMSYAPLLSTIDLV